MSRNSSGVYSLPIGAFSAGGTILASDHNSNYSDIGNEITNSLATTGVSTMTGQVKAAPGSGAAPSYTWGTATGTGFYLPGANQIGIVTNGLSVGTFNSDQSVSWAGAATFTGNTTHNGTITLNGNTTIGAVTLALNASTITFSSTAPFWAGLASNAAINGGFDGGGAPILVNSLINLEIPFACTITRWTLASDLSTTSTVRVFKANAAVPTSGNTITGGVEPALTAATYASSTSLGAWSTTCAARDIIQFFVSVNNNATHLTLSLTVQRTGS